MTVLVGLGNPGRNYSDTKHNFGFWVLDKFAEKRSLKFQAGKGDYLLVKSNDIALVKPTTYMNNSGMAVADYCRYFQNTAEELLVVYDDIAEDKITIYDKGIDRKAVLGENMDFDNPAAFNFNHRSGDVILPKINWIEPLKTEITHFMDCIQNGTECLTDSIHASKVVNILASY